MTKQAILWTNPARDKFETVSIVGHGTKANGFKGWTRVRRACGTSWVPNFTLSGFAHKIPSETDLVGNRGFCPESRADA